MRSKSTASARFPIGTNPRADDAGSDSDVSFYESVDADLPSTAVSDDQTDADLPSAVASDYQVDVDVPVPQHDELDLAYSIKGVYRILDLISEQGSGGLVDKIIISQNSLEAFITTVDPRAYASMTKVNFKALDNYIIKPVGVYGSKEEIVRFLSELGVIDDTIATQLLVDTDTHSPTKQTLRSGLYIIKTTEQSGNTKQIFVLYWPEPGTWDDSAASSVRRNRVTFMRYLTKMCDQVVALISSEHARTIVWNENDEDDNDGMEVDQDESDRMFTFEVAQTNDQEESVTVREGFKAFSDRIALPEVPANGSTSDDPVKPFLLFGETGQGFMTVKHREAKLVVDAFRARTYTPLQLEGYLTSDCLHLSESLDNEALKILVRFGLEKRFPQECSKWKHESSAVQNLSKFHVDGDIARTKTELKKAAPNLRRSLHEAILDEIERVYPCLDRRSFPYFANEGERAVENPEPLSEMITLYPKVNQHVAQQLRQAFYLSTDKEFRTAKSRICLTKELLPIVEKVDEPNREQILRAALEGELELVKDMMKENAKSLTTKHKATADTPSHWAIQTMRKIVSGNPDADLVDGLVRDATRAAQQTTDSEFLIELDHDVEQHPELKKLADEARRGAYIYLKPAIGRLLKKLVVSVQQIQETDCDTRIKREHGSREEEEQRKLRMDLIRRLNSMSKQTAHTHTLRISAAELATRSHYYGSSSSTSYQISGSRESHEDPMVIYTVHLMNLTTQDQHELQLNPTFIPSPRFRYTHSFKLPQGHSVIRAQLLEGEKLLLVVADRNGNLTVYLEGLAGVDGAIRRGRGKALNREKIEYVV
ncbi:hypothetical protein PAXINDRAFT_20962 [Paxillus involutus ATCC 200175]|uniref:Uncharacterized protein n=1 Tax=Paxillus involutus ATCC 200175 TaxID=664439 RepID=A0A0C9SU07_PAXIN|nr:hypothetical protein PAXINDRAFT_20962 [Paxillus involutus ATCC 200175]